MNHHKVYWPAKRAANRDLINDGKREWVREHYSSVIRISGGIADDYEACKNIASHGFNAREVALILESGRIGSYRSMARNGAGKFNCC